MRLILVRIPVLYFGKSKQKCKIRILINNVIYTNCGRSHKSVLCSAYERPCRYRRWLISRIYTSSWTVKDHLRWTGYDILQQRLVVARKQTLNERRVAIEHRKYALRGALEKAAVVDEPVRLWAAQHNGLWVGKTQSCVWLAVHVEVVVWCWVGQEQRVGVDTVECTSGTFGCVVGTCKSTFFGSRVVQEAGLRAYIWSG
jgi:hypothetical protein